MKVNPKMPTAKIRIQPAEEFCKSNNVKTTTPIKIPAPWVSAFHRSSSREVFENVGFIEEGFNI